MTDCPPTIAIIGGGLAGLTLSIGLTHHGIKHKIYEAAAEFSEIGAGIAMGPNAVTALTLLDPRVREAYERCATYNEAEDHRDTWLTYRWGMEDNEKFGDIVTSVKAYSATETGRSCVHRALFLDALIQLIPSGIAEFSKRLTRLTQSSSGVTMYFGDNTTAHASALIACDGIKSICRPFVLGENSPQIQPVFAGEYAYRTLLDRDTVNTILTPSLAGNGNIYIGRGAYIITYPVDHGRLVNVVAVKRSKDSVWPGQEWLAPCPREAMLRDFDHWVGPIRRLIGEIKDSQQWALFDAPEAETFCSGNVCLVGDAAHASTPNQGAGAGMAFEDAFVLSALFGKTKGERGVGVAEVFNAFDHVRRPRTLRLVRTSREAGEVYELVHEGVGDDLRKVKENLDVRHEWIWREDLPGEVDAALKLLREESGEK